MKFAVPYMGCNLHYLLHIGEDVLRSSGSVCKNIGTLQQMIENFVQQRLGIPDISGLLKPGQVRQETATLATKAKQQMTRAEIRLILAAYLGAHIDKDQDVQLFCPRAKRKRRMIVKRAPR